MPGFIAKKLCPELIFVPHNFAKYESVAEQTRTIFSFYDENFESFSLDEAQLNITQCILNRLQSRDIAPINANPLEYSVSLMGAEASSITAELRQRIFDVTQLTASAGIGSNKMLSKIASDLNKPNGQYHLENKVDVIMPFMEQLSIRKIPGIGKVLERILNELGIYKCGDLRSNDNMILLMQSFTELTANWIIRVSLGLASTHHTEEEESKRKSMSCERTFKEISLFSELENKCRAICESLCKDISESSGISGKTLTLKLKNVSFQVFTRSITLNRYIHCKEEITKYALQLLREEIDRLKVIKANSIKNANTANTANAAAAAAAAHAANEQTRDNVLRLRLMGIRLSGLKDEQVNKHAKGTRSIIDYVKPITNSTSAASAAATATSTSQHSNKIDIAIDSDHEQLHLQHSSSTFAQTCTGDEIDQFFHIPPHNMQQQQHAISQHSNQCNNDSSNSTSHYQQQSQSRAHNHINIDVDHDEWADEWQSEDELSQTNEQQQSTNAFNQNAIATADQHHHTHTHNPAQSSHTSAVTIESFFAPKQSVSRSSYLQIHTETNRSCANSHNLSSPIILSSSINPSYNNSNSSSLSSSSSSSSSPSSLACPICSTRFLSITNVDFNRHIDHCLIKSISIAQNRDRSSQSNKLPKKNLNFTPIPTINSMLKRKSIACAVNSDARANTDLNTRATAQQHKKQNVNTTQQK